MNSGNLVLERGEAMKKSVYSLVLMDDVKMNMARWALG